MKILITGDLAITKPYNASAQIGQSIKDLFASSDLNIVNLETPVTSSTSKILKTGPNLNADRQSVGEVLNALNVKVVTLANNHLMDYGDQGVADTLDFCKDLRMDIVGGGMNLKEASKTLYLDTKEGIIAIVNFAENEWSAATPDSAGFNPMDIIDNARQIQDAGMNADFIIVIIHGGHEYYRLPSPRMVKQYRYYAEQGADLIVGHHTHCISGNEVYKGVPIYYSLGNFLFTQNSSFEDWYTGLVLEVLIRNKKLTTVVYPVAQAKDSFSVALEAGSEMETVFSRIDGLNQIISDDNILQYNWEKYIAKQSALYLNFWSPIGHIKNRYIKAALSRLKLNITNKTTLALYLNLMRCEAHTDISREVIGKKVNQ